MKLLIKLTSLIVISMSTSVYAEKSAHIFNSSDANGPHNSIAKLEAAISRQITEIEHAALTQFLLDSYIHKASTTESIKMACVQAQLAALFSFKNLACVSSEGEVYFIFAFEGGLILLANVSAVGIYIEGNPAVIQRLRQRYHVDNKFNGAGVAFYKLAGAQAQYYRGPENSFMIMTGVGLGFGGGATFHTLPYGFLILRW